MPFLPGLLVPLFSAIGFSDAAAITTASIIGAAATAAPPIIGGIQTVEMLANRGGGGGGTPAPSPATPAGPTPQGPTTDTAQKAAVASTLPTLQSLTGGSVSPEYAAQFGLNQTGLNNNPQATGNAQSAINQFFGLGAPGQSGLSTGGAAPSGNSITDLLSRVTSGGGGGGIVDSTLSSDTFHGFGG